jgi:hypothetical protein
MSDYTEHLITQAGGDGDYCPTCDSGGHICGGCGNNIKHGTYACEDCKREHALHP